MADKKFSFFESYHRALNIVPDSSYGRVVRGMAEFVFEGKVPTFSDDVDNVAWELIRPILEHGLEISEARSDAGRKGGLNGKGTSRNSGNNHAIKSKSIANQKQNKSGIGIGKGNKMDISIDTKKIPISERKKNFQKEIEMYKDRYDPNMLNDFFQFWTQPDKEQSEMRFEGEKYWDLKTRLDLWIDKK